MSCQKIEISDLKNQQLSSKLEIEKIENNYISNCRNYILNQKKYFREYSLMCFFKERFFDNFSYYNIHPATYRYHKIISFNTVSYFDMEKKLFLTSRGAHSHGVYMDLVNLNLEELDLKKTLDSFDFKRLHKYIIKDTIFNYICNCMVKDEILISYEELKKYFLVEVEEKYYNDYLKNLFQKEVRQVMNVFYKENKNVSYLNFKKIFKDDKEFIKNFLSEEEYINILNDYKIEVTKNVLSKS